MDIGTKVVTQKLFVKTDVEQAFAPWWIRVQDYAAYFLVVLGLMSIPVNSILGPHGNCSYDYSSRANYILEMDICAVEDKVVKVERAVLNNTVKEFINDMYTIQGRERNDTLFTYFTIKDQPHVPEEPRDTNFAGCWVKKRPILWNLHVYYSCVGELGNFPLYFPYIIFLLALILVFVERLFTRYLMTGKNLNKFYLLLVKEALEAKDYLKFQTTENKQDVLELIHHFRGRSVYWWTYLFQTLLKLFIPLLTVIYCCVTFLNDGSGYQNFKTQFNCKIQGYTHECSIPSNSMNILILWLVQVDLCLIIFFSLYDLAWLTFPVKITSKMRLHVFMKKFKDRKLKEYIQENSVEKIKGIEQKALGLLWKFYFQSDDMTLLLDLLSVTNGVSGGILILSLLLEKFRREFDVVNLVATACKVNEGVVDIQFGDAPMAQYIKEYFPEEHMMYMVEVCAGKGEPIVRCRDQGDYHNKASYFSRQESTKEVHCCEAETEANVTQTEYNAETDSLKLVVSSTNNLATSTNNLATSTNNLANYTFREKIPSVEGKSIAKQEPVTINVKFVLCGRAVAAASVKLNKQD